MRKFRSLSFIAAISATVLLVGGPNGSAPAAGQGLGALFGTGTDNRTVEPEGPSAARAEARPAKRYKSRRSVRTEARRQARRTSRVERADPVERTRQQAGDPPPDAIWPALTPEETQKAAGLDPATFFAERFWFPIVSQPAVLGPAR